MVRQNEEVYFFFKGFTHTSPPYGASPLGGARLRLVCELRCLQEFQQMSLHMLREALHYHNTPRGFVEEAPKHIFLITPLTSFFGQNSSQKSKCAHRGGGVTPNLRGPRGPRGPPEQFG